MTRTIEVIAMCAISWCLYAEPPSGHYSVDGLGYSYSGAGDEVAIAHGANQTTVEIPAHVEISYQVVDGYDEDTGDPVYATRKHTCKVTSIGPNAFRGYSELKNVSIPSSIKSISWCAFYECSNLSNIVIPDSVTSIGDSAFHGCTSITSFAIPSSVTSIGHGIFYGCSSLTVVNIPAGIKNIPDFAFSFCDLLPSVVIPNGVTNIGECAFQCCYSLTSVNIPPNVKNVGVRAFFDCCISDPVVIPSCVEYVGSLAFCWCPLSTVVIPSSVKEMGKQAFWGSSAKLLFLGTSPELTEPKEWEDQVGNCCTGYYLPQYSEDWESTTLDGYWYDVIMHCTGVEPRGCDWTSGTIELGWYGVATNLNPITYNVWWSESEDLASCENKPDHYVGKTTFTPAEIGVQALTIEDTEYLTHGDGLKPIYYHVVGTDGSKSYCKTRNRYGVVAAISSYEDKWQNNMPNAASQAKSFAAELEKSCEKSQNVKLLTDSEVKKDAYRNAISNCAAQAKSGDVIVSFLYSHGGINKKGESVIAFYKKDSCYFAPEMANDISAFDPGVGFVGILYNCHAAEFVDPDADSSRWIEGTALATCTKNRAWIAAAGAEVSTPQDVFGWFFTEYGWQNGWADSAWETTNWENKCKDNSALTSLVTFGALAGYAKRRMHELIWDELKTEPVIFDEFNILGNIAAGSRGTHENRPLPSVPNLAVSKGEYKDKTILSWTKSESADGYALFQYRANGEPYTINGKKTDCRWYLHGSSQFSRAIEKIAGQDNVGYENNKDAYVLKAYNGCGVVKSNEDEGWCSWIEGKIGDLSYAWQVSGVKITILAIGTYENISAFAPGDIEIPATIDDCDVVEIARTAFNGNDVVIGVTIPATVTNIAAEAFNGCAELACVTFKGALPNGVEASDVLSHATKVYYPREYADEYEDVVPSELFAGYTDEEPLTVVTDELANAIEMVQYEKQLECAGGREPYSWSASEEMYLTSTGVCSFAEVGEAQGWCDDDGAWNYDLPFAFNCCGHAYDSIVVYDNAYLRFGSEVDGYTYIRTGFGDLYSLNEEQDIFIDHADDHVTFRWKRVKYSARTNGVNCAITLYSNGVIRYAFGDCYDCARTCYLTAPGTTVAYRSQRNENDTVFKPNYLPLGLTLSSNGVISGKPEQAGHYEFDVTVEDGDGVACTKRLSIDVAANPNHRPTIESWSPYWDDEVSIRGGESGSFFVEASDLDDDELTYRWYWDNEEIGDANLPSYNLLTDKSMRGWHKLSCEVSDGVWTIAVHEWEVSISGEMTVSADDGADALQNALDEAVDGDVIYVGPGTYSPIENWSRRGVHIVATEGCENTFIDGEEVSPCVQVDDCSSTNDMIRLEGFTIENGFGDDGGGVSGAWLIGCVVRNNEAEGDGGGMRYGRADSCLIVGNSANYGGGTYCTELHNCTVVGNTSTRYAGGAYAGSRYNTIIWGNNGSYNDSNVGDPRFVDAENGDYSLSADSPCIGMGDNADVATVHDLAGNERIQKGSVDLGAYESAYELSVPSGEIDLYTSPRTSEILLEWSDATYAKWYEVYRVENGLEDVDAECLATVADIEYCDSSAKQGVTYRYWVVPCNEIGNGGKSEYGVDTLLAPLEIVETSLSSADMGSPYDCVVQATGGDGNYTWSMPYHVSRVESKSSFAEIGDPMGWTEDDASWFYELPFDFPAFGSATNLVEVSDNGFIWLPVGDSWATISAALNQDLYANPGDIYVSVTNDAVTFRWERGLWSADGEVNVSATLYANGRIRLSCDGNSQLVDRGIEYEDSEYWYGTSDDIVLTPNNPPAGLKLTEDGLLTGTLTASGTYRFVVKVADGNEECITREISLKVNGDSASPIPNIGDAPSEVEVYEALAGSADKKLQDNITDGVNYNAYRAWAETVKKPDGTTKAGAQGVRDAPTAWVSFALGSDKLLEQPPTDEDLTVEKFEPASESGKFDFTVSVDGVNVGSDAQKENLKQVFGLEGATTLNPDDFSSGNVDLTFGTPADGRVKFTAGPKDTNASTFFMKVKVNP